MVLAYSDKVAKCIADRCTEVETGARNIDHIMRGTILPQLSEKILTRMGTGDMPATVRLDLAEDGGFSISFAEVPAAKPRKKRNASAVRSKRQLQAT